MDSFPALPHQTVDAAATLASLDYRSGRRRRDGHMHDTEVLLIRRCDVTFDFLKRHGRLIVPARAAPQLAEIVDVNIAGLRIVNAHSAFPIKLVIVDIAS
jgi:hypothetical protein